MTLPGPDSPRAFKHAVSSRMFFITKPLTKISHSLFFFQDVTHLFPFLGSLLQFLQAETVSFHRVLWCSVYATFWPLTAQNCTSYSHLDDSRASKPSSRPLTFGKGDSIYKVVATLVSFPELFRPGVDT